jgi:hypothetical protein
MGEKQSGLGIASFVISLLATGALIAVFVFAEAIQLSTPGGILQKPMDAMLVDLATIGAVLLETVALLLGLIALFQRDRRKTFAAVGTILSTLTIALTVVGHQIEQAQEHTGWPEKFNNPYVSQAEKSK